MHISKLCFYNSRCFEDLLKVEDAAILLKNLRNIWCFYSGRLVGDILLSHDVVEKTCQYGIVVLSTSVLIWLWDWRSRSSVTTPATYASKSKYY